MPAKLLTRVAEENNGSESVFRFRENTPFTQIPEYCPVPGLLLGSNGTPAKKIGISGNSRIIA
jgi:hypothetical protein